MQDPGMWTQEHHQAGLRDVPMQNPGTSPFLAGTAAQWSSPEPGTGTLYAAAPTMWILRTKLSLNAD